MAYEDASVAFRVRDVPGDELTRNEVVQGIEATYRDAFGAPPYNEDARAARAFVDRIRTQTDREGLRLLTAQADEGLVGFAYGYRTQPGQWWHDRVTPQIPRDVVDRWFADAFVLVELAVRSRARGRGVGSELLDRILHGLPQRTALTMTHQGENPAVEFYARQGWRPVVEDFRFGEQGVPRVILGRDLTR